MQLDLKRVVVFTDDVPRLVTGLSVVLAGLPTGTGPYMLSALYGRDPGFPQGR